MRWLWLLLALAWVLPAVSAIDDERPGGGDVAVVLSSDSDEYRQVDQAIVEALRDSRHHRKRVRTLQASALDPADADAWPSGSDVVVAVGMRALKRLLRGAVDSPVYAVLVPYASYRELMASAELDDGVKRRLHVLYLDQPPQRLVELVRALKSRFERIGMLVGTETAFDLSAVATAAAEAGYELTPVVVDGPKAVVPALKRVHGDIDLLLTTFDPKIINPQVVRQLLYFSYNRRLPVLGYSQAMVRAGALAAVYSTPAQIGRQAAETLIAALDEAPPWFPAEAFPRYFKVSCNPSVRRYFGLPRECDLQRLSGDGSQ